MGAIINPKIAEKIDELRNDKLHGAGWLSRQAITTLNLAIGKSQARTVADFIDEARMVATELAQARPSMISIPNYIHQFLHQIMLGAECEKDLDSLKIWAQAKGNELVKLSKQAESRAIGYGCGIISSQDTVITCSYSSTVCRAFELAMRNEEEFCVMVAESISNGEAFGEITAKRLQKHQIPVEVIPDESIHLYVSKADKALVGADSILADGTLINGTPTFRLAQAARGENIPFYAVCESAKFDIRGYIAKASEPELGFDKTPPDLITGIITEKGIMQPSLVIAYIETMASLSQ